MSMFLTALSILAAAVYLSAIYQDMMKRQIPNALPTAITVIGCAKWLAVFELSPALFALIVALLVFLVTFGLFVLGWMGGGDVKLLTASSFMLGAWWTYPFLVWTALAGGVVTLVVLLWVYSARWYQKSLGGKVSGTVSVTSESRPTVPYGVAIAIGALWVMFQQSLLSQQTLLR